MRYDEVGDGPAPTEATPVRLSWRRAGIYPQGGMSVRWTIRCPCGWEGWSNNGRRDAIGSALDHVERHNLPRRHHYIDV